MSFAKIVIDIHTISILIQHLTSSYRWSYSIKKIIYITCTKTGKRAVMYLCDISTLPPSTIFLLEFRTVPTLWYFCNFILCTSLLSVQTIYFVYLDCLNLSCSSYCNVMFHVELAMFGLSRLS
jgi:hypothetical protein